MRSNASLLVGCLFMVAHSNATASDGSPPNESGAEPCVVVAALEPPRATPAKTSRKPAKERSMAKELRRPMTEGEIQRLVRALEPLDLGSGIRARRAAAEQSELSPERMRVLIGDVTALLADLHAQELLDQLKHLPDYPGADRRSFERDLDALQACARGRFRDRGGDRVYQESLGLVERQREQLEHLLLAGPDRTRPNPKGR